MFPFQVKFSFGCPAWLEPWIPPGLAPWIPLILLVAALALCVWLVARLYRRLTSSIDRRSILLLLTIRSLALLILLLFLFRPEVSYVRSAGERPILALLLDSSRSMGVRDHPDLPARLDQVKSVLRHPPAPLQEMLGHFDTRIYTVDAQTREIAYRDIPLLDARGEATFLIRGVKDAVSAMATTRLRGVILFSDGADNSAAEPESELSGLGYPVHTVGVGAVTTARTGFRDVRLSDLETPRVVTVNQLAQVHAYVDAAGFRDQVATVRLLREGKDVAQTTVVLDDAPGPQKVALNYAPREAGRQDFLLEVVPLPGEQLEQNNRRPFRWDVRDEPVKVLYVEGKPRPEFKFLKRALEQHESTQIITLLKVGPGRFNQQGKIEGIGDLLGFPQDREALERFDVFVFGSIARANFSSAQLEQLRAVVSDGAGFLMLGGYESFGAGDYQGTPVEEMLPVRLGEGDPGQEKDPFLPVLTPDGEEHPIFYGIGEFFPTRSRPKTERIPALLGCSRTAGLKPGASALCIHPTSLGQDKSPLPVIAAQSFGQGRAMAFAADSTWQWYLQLQGMGNESPYVRFWVQSCRWLAKREGDEKSTGPGLVAFLAEEYIEAGRPAYIHARAHDLGGLLTSQARISADVDAPGQQKIHVSLPCLPGTRGNYEATLQPPSPGDYHITVRAELDGQPLGDPCVLNLKVAETRQELENLSLNEGLLQSVASATSGRYVPLAQVGDLASSVWHDERERLIYRHYPLWNAPWLFALFIGLQTLEWVMRKRRHLA
jgi:uncharacterized membrane protein